MCHPVHSITFQPIPLDGTKYVLCLCPCGWSDGSFFGPAAIRLASAHMASAAAA